MKAFSRIFGASPKFETPRVVKAEGGGQRVGASSKGRGINGYQTL
jgi:hypothetical protein